MGFHQFCRTSPTTPAIVTHGSGESAVPSLIRRPTGSAPGQNRSAIPRLMTITGAALAVSASEIKRPETREILNVAKKSGVAICKSAEGVSPGFSAGCASILKKVVSLSTLLAGGLVIKEAC